MNTHLRFTPWQRSFPLDDLNYHKIDDDFFGKWTNDNLGRQVYVGLSFEETEELLSLQQPLAKGRRLERKQKSQFLELANRHDTARLGRVGMESYLKVAI